MHRAPTGRNRIGGDGFIPVPQVDATEEVDYQGQHSGQTERPWTVRDQFRNQVRQVLRQGAIQREQERASIHCSPALSDTTLIGGDYLDVPLHDYDDADLGQYVEYSGYYGLEAANLSPSTSLKAGLGLEVRCEPVDHDLSPGGLQVDEAWKNTSYHGSKGVNEKEVPSGPLNYKPVVLRARFLLALFVSLVILIGLAALAIRRLPNQHRESVPRQAFENNTEIHLRAMSSNEENALSRIRFHERQNDTDPRGSVPETLSTVSTSIEVETTSATSNSAVTTTSDRTLTQDVTPTSSKADEATGGLSTDMPTTVTTPSIPTTTFTTNPVTEPSTPTSQPQSTTSLAPPDSPISIPEAGTTVSDTIVPSTDTPETSHHDDQTTTTALPPPVTSSTDVTIGIPTTTEHHDTPPGPQDPTSPHDDPAPPIPSSTLPTLTLPTNTLPTIPSTYIPLPTPTPTYTDPGNPGGTEQPGSPTGPGSPGPNPPFTLPTGPPSLSTLPISPSPYPPFTLSTDLSSTLPTGTGGPGETGPSSRPTIPDNPLPGPPSSWPAGPSSWSISLPSWPSSPSSWPTWPTWPNDPNPDPSFTLPTGTNGQGTNPPFTLPTLTSFPWPTNPSFSLPPGPSETKTDPFPTYSTGSNIPGSMTTLPSGPSTTRVSSNPIPTTSAQQLSSGISSDPATFNTIPSPTDHASVPTSSNQIESYTETFPPPSSPSPSMPVENYSSHITEQLPANTHVEETAPPKPFTTITRIPDIEPPSPPATTTLVTSISREDGIFIGTTMSSATHPIKAHVDYPVTDFVMTYRDSHGRPTLTQTISAQASTQTTIYKDAKGQPTKTDVLVILREPRKTTYTDYQGRATKTQDYYVVESAKVLFDKYGHPTATETSMISETAAARTLFNELGVATETDTILVPMSATTTLVVTPTAAATPSPQDDKTVRIVPMSDGTYFAGLMLPILFAIVLSIPIRMLDQTAKLYQPFHALKSFRGASAAQSLCFQTTGVGGLLAGLRSLLSGQVLPSLTGILVLTSAVLIPLSAEAIHIILAGPECTSSAQVETLTCALTLGISPGPARAIVALLSTMAFLVVAAAAVLWKWKTGLARNPWSLFYMAELSANHDIRLLLRRLREKNGRIRNSDVSKALAGIPFELNYWKDNGVLKYSVLISNESAHPPKKDKSVTFAKPSRKRRGKKGKHPMPFFILTWAGTGLFLLLLCAALIGILTYDITSKDHGYDPGMLGGWSAIRFFFTGAAVAITLLWGSFFYAVAFLSPHRLLHRNRLYKGKALHMTPPVNSFSGIWSSLATGRRDLYLAAVSGTAILSEILPLFVSIILDRGIQNQLAQEICTWMAVGILCVMILTACGSFFVAWPHMPIDPSTVAGAMYYVWDPTTQSSVVSMSPSSGLLFGRVGANMV